MATSLLEWIADLLRDSDARESFFDHPDRYADDHGFSHLSSADVRDTLHLLADDGFPSPRHFDHSDQQHGAHYLRSYFHDNRAFIDNRDGDFDNHIKQDIDTGRGRDRDDHDRHDHDHDRGDFNRGDFDRGGDFNQHIDNDPVVASGDHAVAAHGDIERSFITSGRGNVVGDHDHAITGSGNTTAFGTGNADTSSFDGARFGDGAALSTHGDADGHSEHNSTNTSVHGGDGPTSVNVAGADGRAAETADQHETESSIHSDFDNHARFDDHAELNSHNSVETHDSNDFDIHP